ncbi:MAG: RNA polymerase sigma-I factor [Bacillota bacterium]
MKEYSMDQIIMMAQKGDIDARNKLIDSHKDFIAGISSRMCKRFLTWDNDDEISIALLAFNEAIDKFKPGGGAGFHSFAQRVIRSRLVDYFRRESRHRHLSLSPMGPEDEELSRYDLEYSRDQYYEDEKQADFSEVVEIYMEVLNQYGVTLDDLIRVSPKHRDSKETLMKVALRLTDEPDLLEYLKKYKLLPIKELESITGVKRRVLEKGRKYLIALSIILSDPRFYPLKEFTRIPETSTQKKVLKR